MPNLPCASFACFVWIPILALAAQCRTSTDCKDNEPCTIDYCEPTLLHCLNIPKPHISGCQGTSARLTRAGISAQLERTPLSLSEKLNVTSVAAQIFANVHPHRKFHLKLLQVDPVLLLRQLENELQNSTLRKLSEMEFHERMKAIFKSVDDLHTKYNAPAPLKTTIAILPLLFREFFEKDDNSTVLRRKHVITDLAGDMAFSNVQFQTGVLINKWNGVPIEEAVTASGMTGFGNNEGSKMMIGIRRLARRFLRYQHVPDKEDAVVGFIDENGAQHEIRIGWIYASLPPGMRPASDIIFEMGIRRGEVMYGIANPGINLTVTHNARESIRVKSTVKISTTFSKAVRVPVDDRVAEIMAAEIAPSKNGHVGVITIFSFLPRRLRDFINEFSRLLLTEMPQTGVVIDVRGNIGGDVLLCQFIVQMFTSNWIQPVSFSLRTTPLTISAPSVFGVSQSAGPTAAKIGDQFFGATRPYEAEVNRGGGRRYTGPVVVLVDAKSYSCGDIFAATVKDNDAALIVGEHGSTGGGGSTVLPFSQLRRYVQIPKLPGGVEVSSSYFRIERARAMAGVPIEYFGIEPHVRYYTTRRDRLRKEIDLVEYLGQKLAEQRVRRNATMRTS